MSSEAHSYSKTVFGFWLFLMSDAMMFAALFATYVVLQGGVAQGPSAADLFTLPRALTQTLILLTASFVCGPALLAAHRYESRRVVAWFGAVFVLGLLFVALQVDTFTTILKRGHNWETSAFLSAYFNLVGTHTLHVVIGLIWIAFLMAKIGVDGLTKVGIKRLTSLRLFFHFVNIVWLFIFTFVYLLGVK